MDYTGMHAMLETYSTLQGSKDVVLVCVESTLAALTLGALQALQVCHPPWEA
jgi:hypothetical protein